jgi:hypothetical protein
VTNRDRDPGAPAIEDVVVVVPGILGTELYREGKPVWALSAGGLWGALKTFGGSVKQLTLPADIGDDDPGDGVEPRGLMPDLHGIPGIGPHSGGYSDLTRWLGGNLGLHVGGDDEPGNLVEFGYDWRLSNRYNSARLGEVAKDALKRWRDAGHREARLVFFCHSMGGLIARHFLEVGGGAEHTRALVTVGTPHRGSLKALDNLVNGRSLGIGPLRFDVGSLARSFPSAHQLLPTYRCLEEDSGRRGLGEVDVPGLEAHRVDDALAFHEEIETAAKRNGPPEYKFRITVGTRQPTTATARVVDDGVEPLLTIDGNDERGDGTVSRFASIPLDIAPDDLSQLSSSKRHGWLQQSRGVLDDFYGILTARTVVYMSDVPKPEDSPGIELPEVLEPGEPLQITATSADPELLMFAEVSSSEQGSLPPAKALRNLGGGRYAVELRPLPEGAYTVTVRGKPGTVSFEPIVDGLLVAVSEPQR